MASAQKSGRGQWLIIVNAIERSGPIPNALLIFRSKSTITPDDYHKDMDAHNFEKWFQEQLLPNLKSGSVIVMDNAPYHSRRNVSLPSKGRRAEVIAQLEEVGFFQFLAARGLPFRVWVLRKCPYDANKVFLIMWQICNQCSI